MCTNDSNSGRGSKTSSPLCLPSNKRRRRDECALGTHQNTTVEAPGSPPCRPPNGLHDRVGLPRPMIWPARRTRLTIDVPLCVPYDLVVYTIAERVSQDMWCTPGC